MPPNPSRKPVYTARRGNVTVKVQAYGDGRMVIAWREFAGAPRIRETFTQKRAAMDRADEIARAIADGQAESVSLTGADRESYRRAINVLRPLGVPLHIAVEEYATARRTLPDGYSLQTAVEQLAERVRPASVVCPPTAEIVAAYFISLRENPDRGREEREVKRMEARAKHIAERVPNFAEAKPNDAERFLWSLRAGGPKAAAESPVASAKTRDHYLGLAKSLHRFAILRGWLPAGYVGAFDHLQKSFRNTSVQIFTVAEMRALLDACPEEWLPFVAIGAFAGLRVAEVGRLKWQDIRWDESEIVLDRAITKTSSPRNVPMEPVLLDWLLPRAKKFGRLYDYSDRGFEKATQRLHRTVESAIEGFEWHDNALRHSYGSYLYGRDRNLAVLRANMGNSEAMVQTYYNSPRTKVEGAAWFELRPVDKSRKVISIGGAA